MSEIEKLNEQIDDKKQIDKLNKQIDKLNQQIEVLNNKVKETREEEIKQWRESSDNSMRRHNTVCKFSKEMNRYKQFTRDIKNLRLEYEHENSREFSTKLIMLLEKYKDNIKDMMKEETDEDIIEVMNSVFRFE